MVAPAPVAGRHLILSHWSNGNPLWSAGPPTQDALMTVGYVKAYFNSSDPARQNAASSRCKNTTAYGAYCPIPNDPLSSNSLYSNFFYTMPNSTNGQIVYANNGVSSRLALLCVHAKVLAVLSLMAAFFFWLVWGASAWMAHLELKLSVNHWGGQFCFVADLLVSVMRILALACIESPEVCIVAWHGVQI